MRYPERLLTDDERIVHQFRPHWRTLLSALGWGVTAVAVVVAGWTVADQAAVSWAITGLGGVLVLAMAAPPLVRWLFTQYVLTTERIIVRTGVISRTGTEIPLESINDVRFSQSVSERLLGYGDILVESAGSRGQSRLSDIPDPEAFQSEIYGAREERSLHMGGGGGGARDPVAQLESLARLREQGAVTDEEFAAAKQRLLGEISPPDGA